MSDGNTYDYAALLSLMQGGGIPAQNAGVVDDYGGVLTDLNKLAGMATDWDFLAQNPHLITAEGLADTTTYSPVELQYESIAEAYRRSLDPRLNEIMYYVDEGTWSPQAIAESIAEETGVKPEEVDTPFIERALSRLSQAEIDDQIARQGAKLMVDSDGVEKYMVGETKEHPFLEHVRNLGYLNDPRAAYDPYDIAPVGQRERDIETVQKYEDDNLASEKAMRAYSEAAKARANRNQILRDRAESQADPGRNWPQTFGADASTRRQIYDENPAPRFGPGSTSMGKERAIPGEYGGRGEEPTQRRWSRPVADDERYAALGRASRAASLDAWRSEARARAANLSARAREDTVRRLLDAGFSPFAEEVRRRNSGIVPGI